jgi:hypothetical protein
MKLSAKIKRLLAFDPMKYCRNAAAMKIDMTGIYWECIVMFVTDMCLLTYWLYCWGSAVACENFR